MHVISRYMRLGNTRRNVGLEHGIYSDPSLLCWPASAGVETPRVTLCEMAVRCQRSTPDELCGHNGQKPFRETTQLSVYLHADLYGCWHHFLFKTEVKPNTLILKML